MRSPWSINDFGDVMNWIRRIALGLGVIAIAVGGMSHASNAAPPAVAGLHAGDLDPTFGTGGRVTTDFGALDAPTATAIQPDGKIVVVGDTDNPPDDSFAVARYNADGSLDSSFGSGGKVTTDFGGTGFAFASAVGIQPDGRIVVAGSSRIAPSGAMSFALARYDTDGSLDASFGAGGKATTVVGATSFANAMAIQPDGKIVVAGSSSPAIGSIQVSFALARYDTDGSLDASFGADGTLTTTFLPPFTGQASAHAIALQPDGKIIAAGEVGAGEGHSAGVVRYTSNGSLDASFGTGGTTTTSVGVLNGAAAVALQPDGKIIIVGFTLKNLDRDSLDQWLLVRYDTDGSPDSSFGSGGTVIGPANLDEATSGIAIQHDGKIVVAGNITTASLATDIGLRRYNTDGSLDTSFGTGGTVVGGAGFDPAVALQADGRIVVAGEVLSVGNGDFTLIRFLGDAPPTVSAGGPYSGAEGAAVALSGAVSDPGATHSWTVVAQSGVDAGAACTVADPAALSTTVTCTDDGVYAVTLTATGVSDPTTLTVDNAAPTVTITSPADGALISGSTPITAQFTDPGSNDAHTCTGDFGDGASSTGTVAESAGTCTLTHAFTTGPHDVAVTVRDDDGGVGSAAVHLVSAVPGAAFGLRATGPVAVPATPQVSCPPDQAKTTAALHTPVVSITGLSASCHVDPGTGVTTASATAGTIAVLGVIHIAGIDSTCTSTSSGLTGSSHVGTINGRPIGTGPGSIGIPGVAQVFFNQTVTGNGQLTQNAIRIHTLLGEDIILASCHLG